MEDTLDGWPIGHAYRYPQHKNMKDRLCMVNKWKEEFPQWNIPTVVDTMNNDFNNAYAAWPDRGFIIDPQKKIQYIANVNDDGSRDCAWTSEIKKVLGL